MPHAPILSATEHAFVAAARTATLATVAADGRPRLVPVCFALSATLDLRARPVLWTPIDEKPKRSADPRRLARIRDVLRLPVATLLVQRWDEDWSRLGWVRLDGRADVLEPEPPASEEHATAIAALREKYPQYRAHALGERPLIRLAIDAARSWGRLETG